MAEAPALADNERRAILRSLDDVGPSKPVGYLPLRTLEKLLLLSPDAVAAGLTARGLATARFASDEACIRSGALYVFHRTALHALLTQHADAVRIAGLPLDPDRFVARIATTWFDENHPAMPIIAAAFGNQ
jgi:hypothetical protein